MNGFGYDPMMMYPNSPYSGYGMQHNQPQNDPNQQEQQSLVEHLRTCVSGLSAITGISYAFASLFRILAKTLKFLNIFKGRKETNQLLNQVWSQTVKRNSGRSLYSMLKYFVMGLVVVAQFGVYFFIRRKRQLAKEQEVREAEEEKLSYSDLEDDEISLEDFMFKRKLCK